MKRIAIYINTQYNSGGTFQYTKSLIKAIDSLSSDKLSLTLLYTYNSWEDYLNSYPNTKKVFLKKSQLINKFYKVFISFGFIRILKFIAGRIDKEIQYINNQRFDLIFFPAGDAIACLVRANVIAAIHDLMHRYERRFKESGGFFNYRFRENFFKSLLVSSKAVIVDSLLGEKHVRESYEKILTKIYILPFIGPDYIYSLALKEKIIPPRISSFRSYIFYPAQFWPHKNHINLLKALKILNDRGEIIDLILSGTQDREYRSLNEYIIKNSLLSQVKFSGYINDQKLVELYRNALALVMPTFYGPTNIPPIEAILLGCPPIVSNIYAMPDQFEDAALYFNPEDPADIANRIESILLDNELRERIIENGERLRQKFSQERFSNDLTNILTLSIGK
jgi:glycosyltransferase involved in cell wall biosynthesis